MKRYLLAVSVFVLFVACAAAQQKGEPMIDRQKHGEPHLHNIKQLTFGGSNAEAYLSADDKQLSYQSTHGELKCDQIFVMNLDGSDNRMVSTGKGRTTCAYLFPDGKHILYSSTHLGSPECPPPPDWSKGYTWALYPDYDIFVSDLDGKNLHQLTTTPGYDAEATISRDGKKIAFTSMRNGDLDIYVMDADGTHVRQLTHELGYDGGPFWSYDGKWIVYRAYHPQTEEQKKDYLDLLHQNLIKPTTLEIWVMKADGSQKHQVTNLNAASFAPYFFPDGKRIIFSSNYASTEKGMGNFELWAINTDGSRLEKVTDSPGFDGFPMFTRDGKKLVWESNRGGREHETNIFVADWTP